eukprot:6190400-Pleurochrysis_carterae.AAC.3
MHAPADLPMSGARPSQLVSKLNICCVRLALRKLETTRAIRGQRGQSQSAIIFLGDKKKPYH